MSPEHPWPGQVLRSVIALNGYDGAESDERVVTDIEHATVVTSEVEGRSPQGDTGPLADLHRPVLDIDFPAELVPSSTPGHFHLYLDRFMSWERYEKLLTALAEAGVIEQGYADAAIRRGYSAVRLPWIKKGGA